MTGRTLTLLFFTTLLVSFSAYAQSGATGAIAGVVVDGKGIPISRAQIEITAAGSSTADRTVFSDDYGNFTVPSLPVGPYDVVVKASGFSTSKYSSVTVRLTETMRLNPSLAALHGETTEATIGPEQ